MNDLHGKRLALLVTGKDAQGNDDWAVFTGTARIQENVVVLVRNEGKSVEIPSEWVTRIKPVPPETRDILLNAEFYLPLAIGPLLDGESAEDYIETGLKWPQ